MFFQNIFGNERLKFKVKMHLDRDSYVDELEKRADVTDKDYILFALLIYARMLKLLQASKSNRSIEPCNIFIEYSSAPRELLIKQSYKFCELLLTISNTSQKIMPLSVKMKQASISCGWVMTKELDKYIYMAYFHSWVKINESQRIVLFDAFVELSKIALVKNLTSLEAISIPNQIVSKL